MLKSIILHTMEQIHALKLIQHLVYKCYLYTHHNCNYHDLYHHSHWPIQKLIPNHVDPFVFHYEMPFEQVCLDHQLFYRHLPDPMMQNRHRYVVADDLMNVIPLRQSHHHLTYVRHLYELYKLYLIHIHYYLRQQPLHQRNEYHDGWYYFYLLLNNEVLDYHHYCSHHMMQMDRNYLSNLDDLFLNHRLE
ncbi:unnamed protein product [Schistosoma margrebowiei]|uniref:Uncharacterized protein n=1 Tax=Schistosoma margrebowiei TaxID=48269 RepID=A0A183MNK9_9TREM|nr:unnamed protein product [Schistosoma margrebowiei]